MVNEIELEHVFIFIIVAFILYHLMKGRGCGCNLEGFTPLDTIQTSLDESINNPSCCISNTAGYSTDPIAVSGSAPGFATRSAYANPCN
jgi:hypothetical protein